MDWENWLTPLAAVELLEPRYGKDAKRVIVTRCERGLLDGLATILVNTFHNRTEAQWDGEYERYFEVPCDDTRHELRILPSTFWSKAMADAPAEGCDDQDGFGRTVYADWEIGDFGFKQVYCPSDAPEQWDRSEAAGVHFNRKQIQLVAGPARTGFQTARELPPSRNKYDWEAAIAAFGGAQNKLDVVPDLYAHGAQAEIERWLSAWFEARGENPAEPTIRPKAALILREYQKADGANLR